MEAQEQPLCSNGTYRDDSKKQDDGNISDVCIDRVTDIATIIVAESLEDVVNSVFEYCDATTYPGEFVFFLFPPQLESCKSFGMCLL